MSGWDYDVMVLFNMTQRISAQRRKNFIRLLRRRAGVVALCFAALRKVASRYA